MTKTMLLVASLCACAAAQAQETARVLSSTPVVQQVGVPRQVCTTETVQVQQPRSGAGAVLGALAGAAIGSAAGTGHGRPAAAAAGAIGGAILGDRLEGAPETSLQNVQRCSVQTVYENRTVAYNVVYEFAGRQYSTQLASDPGPSLQVQVSPSAGLASAPQSLPAQVQPAPLLVTPVQAPVYYSRPYYYPPVTLDLGWGYWGGHHHWR
jgi:uncharacterized protein YcfJ